MTPRFIGLYANVLTSAPVTPAPSVMTILPPAPPNQNGIGDPQSIDVGVSWVAMSYAFA
jgi:hypothetical protein